MARQSKTQAERPAPTPGTQREQLIEQAIVSIERAYGKGSIMRLDPNAPPPAVEVIPTGSLLLDNVTGVGGYPRGRIVEIFGPESSGKTTLALHAIAEAQRRGGLAAFIDAEHALDVTYARKLGVKTSDLLISQPDYGEQALDIAESLVRTGALDVVVVDSVAALVPKSELEGEMGDAQVGAQARLMSQAMRKITAILGRSRCCLIFINQIRMKIGVMFGSPETTTGGQALKFYASMRFDVRRIGAVRQGDQNLGNNVRVKVVKNKLAPPFREAEFEILFGEGISRAGTAVDLGVQHGLLDKSGSWYAYRGEQIGQGKEAAKRYLLDHPELLDELEAALRDKMGLLAQPATGDDSPPEPLDD